MTNLSNSFCSAGDSGYTLPHVIFASFTRSMAWSYGLCFGNLLEAAFENKWRYLWYFFGTLSLASIFVVAVAFSSANV